MFFAKPIPREERPARTVRTGGVHWTPMEGWGENSKLSCTKKIPQKLAGRMVLANISVVFTARGIRCRRFGCGAYCIKSLVMLLMAKLLRVNVFLHSAQGLSR